MRLEELLADLISRQRALLVESETPALGPVADSGATNFVVSEEQVLQFSDMRDEPEKFFLAHRLLSTVGLGGFGIRFTVQFNLFAGSIMGMASERQIAEWLPAWQRGGKLGCFLLTEVQAGVLSGLIVKTTATQPSSSRCRARIG